MNELRFRPATRGDRTRILEIAAQVWEGEDYIPDVIDNWLAPGRARLVVATLDDQVVAIARYERTAPGYVWLEGLRTDPAYQNRGIAKAMTEHMIRRAQADRADRVALSTYFDNYASQRVTETYGFVRVASFAYCRAAAGLVREVGIASSNIESLSVDEAVPFILASEALRLGHGFLPHSWRFYPFTRGRRAGCCRATCPACAQPGAGCEIRRVNDPFLAGPDDRRTGCVSRARFRSMEQMARGRLRVRTRSGRCEQGQNHTLNVLISNGLMSKISEAPS